MKTISSLLFVTFLLSTVPSQLFASDPYLLNEQWKNATSLIGAGTMCIGMGCLTAVGAIRHENCCRRNRGLATPNILTMLTAEFLIGGTALVGVGYALLPSFNP